MLANSVDPDQMPHSAMSDLDLHCTKTYQFQCLGLLWFCLFDLGLTSLSTFFSHIATVSGCGRELNAHFLECCLTEISRPRHFDMIFHPVTLY